MRQILFKLASVLLIALTTCTVALAANPQLKVRGKLQYVHGVNLGWMFQRYSTDLGLNPLHPEWGNGYNSAAAGMWLTDISQMKVNVVRLWLFESLEGLNFDRNGYVSGLQPGFLANLDDMMLKANQLGLAYELVLTTHTLDLDFGKKLPNNALVKNFTSDATARSRFIVNAVRPLVTRYKGNLAVFSYDVMNESDLGVLRGVCTQAQLRTFTKAVATNIHLIDPAAQVTCSCAFYKFNSPTEHAAWYKNLDLNFYENHNYATQPNLATVPTWLDKPLLLGEYGPSLPAPDYTGQFWTDAEQNASANAHIAQAAARGWAGSMAWMYWHSPNFGESIAAVPGGANQWEAVGFTIKNWGIALFDPPQAAIYQESLATDWIDWSWDSAVNFNATDKPFTGAKSMKVTSLAGWSGVYLRKGTAVDTTPFSKIRFQIYTPNAARTFSFFVQSVDGGPASPDVMVETAANQWTSVTIDLLSLGDPAAVKLITLQQFSSTAIGDFWIDELTFAP